MDKPRGIRNSNPGNLRWGDPWQGLVPAAQRTDKDFCQFIAPAWGIRALAITLITYQDKHHLQTVAGMIMRWAPPSENNTAAYIDSVASAIGVNPGQTIDVHDYAVMLPLLRAIIRHENGVMPYSATALDEGLRMAGVVTSAPRKLPSPMAVAVTTGGTAAAVESVQQMQPLFQAASQAADATAGWPQWLKLLGAVLVLASLAAAGIAWWRQRRAQRAVQP